VFTNELKNKLNQGGTAIGTFVTCNSPDIVEVLALSGFEFLVIDIEHGYMSVESVVHLIRAAEARNITPIVRVSDTSETNILRALDIGTHGIQIPQINTKEVAQQVANYSKYYPAGIRGLAMPRAADYGMVKLQDYIKKANDETLVVAHCESKEGLDNLDAIASTPGIDVIFAGPLDLSQSLGIPGEFNHPKLEEAISKILEIARAHGKAAGIFVPDGDQAKIRIKQGFQYITLGLDLTLLAKAASHELNKLKKN